MKSKIREVIIVEGRDDTAAVLRAVDAQTIETHGFGMSDRMWEQIGTAARTRGIIIFTDPDRAGENIRRKVKERFPEAGEAFLPRDKALRGTNIGVENASPEAIREALAGPAAPNRMKVRSSLWKTWRPRVCAAQKEAGFAGRRLRPFWESATGTADGCWRD